MQLSPLEFEALRQHIHQLCGLVINKDKDYLIHQRLGPVIKACGFNSFSEFLIALRGPRTADFNDQIVAAITTNETSFFRDTHPYDAFWQMILPRLERTIQDRKNRPHPRSGAKVRLWSAGTSTGQEPYSLAMLIWEYVQAKQYRGLRADDFEIVATDISTEVMAKAIAGTYSDFELKRGLPPEKRAKYFRQEGSNWVIQPWLQNLIAFRRANLIESFGWLGNFDVIFCRNVLIYFDDPTKQRICGQFHRMLVDGGVLLLGASENLMFLQGTSIKFNTWREGETVMYEKKGE